MDGNYIENEYGNYETEYKQKSIEFIPEEKADKLFWKQVLTGDASDNVKGLWRVGEKTAEKILKDASRPHIKVMREYISRNQKEDFYDTYKLLKLGTN
jgi:5'-3' exonuclease